MLTRPRLTLRQRRGLALINLGQIVWVRLCARIRVLVGIGVAV